VVVGMVESVMMLSCAAPAGVFIGMKSNVGRGMGKEEKPASPKPGDASDGGVCVCVCGSCYKSGGLLVRPVFVSV
jgi:hypothetical protein